MSDEFKTYQMTGNSIAPQHNKSIANTILK